MPRRRLFKKPDTWEYGHDAPADEKPLAKPGKGRVATMFVYAALFVAGGALTAFAGDRFSQINAQEDAAATDASTTTDASADAAPAAEAPAPEAAAPASAPEAAAPEAAAPADTSAETSDATAAPSDPSADDSAPTRSIASTDDTAAPRPAKNTGFKTLSTTSVRRGAIRHSRHDASSDFVLLPATKPAPKPEIEGPANAATVWLNSPLPDPTPPAARLSPAFAQHLRVAASANGVQWSLLLGALRAKGATGRTPADAGTLNKLADRLSTLQKGADGQWATALAYGGSASFADRALALARYDRAVGLNALVRGLEAAKPDIAQRLLSDPAISIYAGGRSDIVNNKVDVRVLALIAYLKESFGSVTVSCLISGHRLYARPGVVSAHIFGRAVDIAALGGTPIQGHQAPGGLTEQAVRDMLLLPGEVMPRQIISLLGLGGPSFPLADHFNHIHVGF
jgi:hypothetical protein